MPSIKFEITAEQWVYRTPFQIARSISTELDVIVVALTDGAGHTGRGEAAGVDYDGETVVSMRAQLEAARPAVEARVSRAQAQELLPAGGARNALDCALWDLEAKARHTSAWKLAGINAPAPVVTAATIGMGTDEAVVAEAERFRGWPWIKIKVNANRALPVVQLIASITPHSRFIVDPNQSWSVELLNDFVRAAADLPIGLIEQPVAVDATPTLANYRGSVPIAADEACADRSSLAAIRDFYQVINIKLDKTGGLTEALALKADVLRAGLQVMVGNMAGTSLAMAPGIILAQGVPFVDLDGPLLHKSDRPHGLQFTQGQISMPATALWG